MSEGRKAAQAKLQDAMEEHVKAWSDGDRAGLLVDWATVAQITTFNDEGDRCSSYHLIFSGGELEPHRALGLFQYGQHMLQHGGPAEES